MNYKKYMRMRKIHRELTPDSYRLGAVFLVIKAMLWLLGVDKEFIGLTIYLDSVGTTTCGPSATPDEWGNHQFGLRLWFKDWP